MAVVAYFVGTPRTAACFCSSAATFAVSSADEMQAWRGWHGS
jgi:hypothetical protein